MSQFNEEVVKIDLHNVAYNAQSHELTLGPTSRGYIDGSMKLTVSLHKWTLADGPNKGNYISLLELGENPVDRLEAFKSVFVERGPALFEEIEAGAYGDNVYTFRWSVNAWRSVVKKKTKWAFSDTKPEKGNPSRVQRLLDT